METFISKAYNGLRDFVDQFANSTTDSNTTPRQTENRKAWYAEWDDNYISGLLENNITKAILKRIADKYYGEQLDEILETATELTCESYPSINDVYVYCCDTLGIFTRPKAYITSKIRGINALSLEVNNKQIILISPQCAIVLSPEEQAFLLGHEISHHQQGNLVCHTVNGLMDDLDNASEIIGPLVLDTIEVPLKRWSRRSEFNADRAGYICCKNFDSVKQLFLRLGMTDNNSAYSEYLEVSSAHPLLNTRWNMLNEFISKTIIQ